MTGRWVDRQADLDELIDALVGEPRYAIDTEFHREKTYFPRLALVQLAWPGDLVLVDPLAVDPTPFARLFDSPALAVAHAAQQDLDVLTHAVGAIPRRLFDTQVAAGFVGYGTPSLVSLLQGELGITPAKGDRLTDWLRRPLTDAQQAYAAADVASLLELQDRLVAAADGARPPGVGRGRVRGAAHAGPTGRHRPGDGVGQAEGRPVAAVARPAPWPRPSPRGASGRPRRTTRPCARCCPTWRSSASPSASRRRSRSWPSRAGVDERHRRGRIGREIVAAVAAGKAGRAAAACPTPSTSSTARSGRPSRSCRRG